MSEPESPADKKRRTSITKLQRETAAGAELIGLCQSITDDGRLDDNEIASLRQWLVDHRESDLPARDFLLATVERILVQGTVSADQREELYRAIEGILPPDIRESVRGKRVAIERVAKEEEKHQRDAAKAAELAARLRNRPVGTWDFMVAGVLHEGRAEVVRHFATVGEAVFLIRDRQNRHSRSAIEIRLSNGMQVGFVPEEYARAIAPLLDSGHRHGAYLKKVLTGGRAPYPVVLVSLYSPDAERPDAVAEQQVPAAQTPLLFDQQGPAVSRKPGCLGLLLLAAALAVTAACLLIGAP